MLGLEKRNNQHLCPFPRFRGLQPGPLTEGFPAHSPPPPNKSRKGGVNIKGYATLKPSVMELRLSETNNT